MNVFVLLSVIGFIFATSIQAKDDVIIKETDKIPQFNEDAVYKFSDTEILGFASFYANMGGKTENEKNYPLALKWFDLAAKKGNKNAMVNLGYMYENGLGVKKDHKRAMFLYIESAKKGSGDAEYRLGKMYSSGEGVEKDYKTALMWYQSAAEGSGNKDAMFELGLMYERGQGFKADRGIAKYWFEEYAKFIVPGVLTNKTSKKTKDFLKARAIKLAEYNIASAQYFLGCLALGEMDDEQAVNWIRLSAQQGYHDAQRTLGMMHESGMMVRKNDKQAEYWKRKAHYQDLIK
jgi:TPR repeat protein